MEQHLVIKHYSCTGALLAVYKKVPADSLKVLGEHRILFLDEDEQNIQLFNGIFTIREQKNESFPPSK